MVFIPQLKFQCHFCVFDINININSSGQGLKLNCLHITWYWLSCLGIISGRMIPQVAILWLLKILKLKLPILMHRIIILHIIPNNSLKNSKNNYFSRSLFL